MKILKKKMTKIKESHVPRVFQSIPQSTLLPLISSTRAYDMATEQEEEEQQQQDVDVVPYRFAVSVE